MENWKSFLEASQESFLADLIDFLRIPSISTQPEYQAEVKRAAEWLATRMESAGLEHVEVLATDGHPIVYGEWLHAENAPTLLLYGHYDVQPVDPLELWTTPPFAPDLREGRLFARGASDMKGNVLVMIHALEAHLRTAGSLPINLRVVIEGEEEIGSRSLPKWLAENRDKIACDIAASADSAQLALQIPTLIVGAKGMCGLQMDVKTAETDLHSGLAGGVVHNALHVASQIVASMHDEAHRVTVAGFYDDVSLPAPDERAMCARMPLREDDFRKSIGVNELISEPGFTPMESTWFRPTLEVNGMWGGFQGEGTKTIIPCVAHVKITCRLVANQQPAKIIELLKAHLARVTPSGVEVHVTPLFDMADPYLLPEDHPATKAADAALQDVMGGHPMHMRMGATVPILGMLKELLGVEVLSLGFSGIRDGMHAPNESLDLSFYRLGAHVYARLFETLATLRGGLHSSD